MSEPADEIDWAAPFSLSPDPDLLDRIGLVTPEPKHDCILLGPSRAGKSSLLSALGRAWARERTEDPQISLLRGSSLAELSGAAALFVGSAASTMQPTESPTSYDFQVTIQNQRGNAPLEVEVLVQDWPGGVLFGDLDGNPPPQLEKSPQARACLRAAREVSSLVFCVDSMLPDRLRWEIVLPQILSGLTTSAGRFLPRLGRLGRDDVPPILSPKRHLPFDRVLILLTKIDLVCAAVADSFAAAELPRRGPVSPLLARLARNPHELAQRLDPVRLAEGCFGKALIDQLLAALKPNASLAVGLTSSWGFEDPAGKSGRSVSALEKWSPFGLREALLYLATGDARHPVVPIHRPEGPGGASGKRWREVRPPRSGNDFLRLISTLGGQR